MKIKKSIIVIAIILSIIILYIIMENNNSLTIEVASAFYPFSQEFLEENELNTNSNLKMASTGQAYTDLINNKVDIIIASGASDEQKQEIEDSENELVYVYLYSEPLAILVNSENTIENLSIDQIQEIYYSEEVNWESYGDNNSIIHTYQLEKNNGSQTAFETIVKNNILGDNNFEIKTMPSIIDNIASDNSSIGYSFYSYFSKMHYTENVKIIKVNDKDILSEDYPLLFEVYLIYEADNEKARDFVEKLDIVI